MKTDLFFDWQKMDWQVVDAQTRRKTVCLDKLMHVLVEIKAGGIGPIHGHPHEQTGYILKGRLEVTLAGKTRELSVGQGYLVPPNVLHGVRVLGDEDVWILDTFTPIREDFLREKS